MSAPRPSPIDMMSSEPISLHRRPHGRRVAASERVRARAPRATFAPGGRQTWSDGPEDWIPVASWICSAAKSIKSGGMDHDPRAPAAAERRQKPAPKQVSGPTDVDVALPTQLVALGLDHSDTPHGPGSPRTGHRPDLSAVRASSASSGPVFGRAADHDQGLGRRS